MTKKAKIKPRKLKKKNKINLDEIPSSNRRTEFYKKKRQQRRIKSTIFKTHFLLKIVLVIFLLFCSSRIMICHFWYLPQNLFETYPSKNLIIRGNQITPNDKIIAALKQHPIQNKPIYLINTSPYEKEIEKLSPVKKAFVRRYWLPARFEVTIEEQIPVLTIAPNPYAPEIAAITLNKEIISKEYLPIKNKKNKTYKILTYDDYTKWTSHEIKSLETLAQRIEDFSQEKILYLDVRNKKDVYAQLETTKIRIGELNSTLKDRIEKLSSVMPQIENLKSQTDYVDLRWDNTVYLKKKSKNQVVPKILLNSENEDNNIQKQTINEVQPSTIQNKPATKQETVHANINKPVSKTVQTSIQKTQKNISKPKVPEKKVQAEDTLNTLQKRMAEP